MNVSAYLPTLPFFLFFFLWNFTIRFNSIQYVCINQEPTQEIEKSIDKYLSLVSERHFPLYINHYKLGWAGLGYINCCM